MAGKKQYGKEGEDTVKVVTVLGVKNYTEGVLVPKFRPYLGICKLIQGIEMGNSKTAICHLREKDQSFPTYCSISFL